MAFANWSPSTSTEFRSFVAADWAADLDLAKSWPGYDIAGDKGRPEKLPRRIAYAGGALVIELDNTPATQVTLPAALANVQFDIAPRRVLAAGTTATALIVMW